MVQKQKGTSFSSVPWLADAVCCLLHPTVDLYIIGSLPRRIHFFYPCLAEPDFINQAVRKEHSICADIVEAYVPSYIAACLASLLALISLYEP